MSERIVIIGGGVAGLAAGVRLAEAGAAVTLLETRQKLGGRATSHQDPKTGQQVDNCQHVVMGCCTCLLDLYERLGVADLIEWHERLHFIDTNGQHDQLYRSAVPAPLHLSRSLLAFGSLTFSEKRAIARAMLAMMRMSRADRDALADTPFSQLLEKWKQPASLYGKFWNLVIVSACNEPVDRCSARYAIQVFQEGFLAHRDAYVMGVSRRPLVDLYDPAVRAIERNGGEVRLGAGVERLVWDESAKRITAAKLSRSDEQVPGDWFISAVPFDRLAKLTAGPMQSVDSRLQRLDEIEASPIIGVHLYVTTADGQPVTDLPHVALMDSPVHWFFNKAMIATAQMSKLFAGEVPEDLPAKVQYLHGVVSGAGEMAGQPAAAIVQMAMGELQRVFGKSADKPLRLVHGSAVKEKRATFSCRPGVDAARSTTAPPAGEGVGNLMVAGDWSDTGWPATMEGAARSGYHAAAAVLTGMDRSDAAKAVVVEDLRPAGLYRLLTR